MASDEHTGDVRVLWEVIDDLLEHLGTAEIDDVARARKEYDERRGRVFEDEELWEAWTQSFLEWYVVERVGPGASYPPGARALAAAIDPARTGALRAWLTSHRSLFEVQSMKAGHVALLDLIGGGRFSVSEQRVLHGVSVGDVAEMRIIGYAGEVSFGRTFCYHPTGTRDAIVGHATRMLAEGADRRDAIDYCASLRIRCLRYRHVSPVRIYETATAAPQRANGDSG